ncbi:sensor histidine kinase [Brevibacillus ginsengisoli]|uniref:sensor histidine kinase n=1 Tax=Brevibacillus ginsengisoli TaxID=363854 RepID=UPI003CF8A916
MKLFLRDQIPFALLFIFQLVLILLIFLLGGLHETGNILYAIFLTLFFTGIFLVFRYWSNRRVYQRLSQPVKALDDLTQEMGDSPIAQAVAEMNAQQYRLYKEQLHLYENKQREYNTFIQQWVHQMKTPISVIHLLLQEEDSQVSTSVREEVDRLKRGLETVLYIARLDRFEHDFVIELVPLKKLVQNVLTENKRLLIRNQVYPEVIADSDWRVESDEKWLSFVLNQLITNAVRYSAGVSRKVSIRLSHRGQQAVLEVRDYGIGIPKEDLHRVFQPYFTGENGRKYPESTGMGLYLVQEICKRLGHAVELESQVGEGTSIRLIFSAVVSTLQSCKETES